MLMPFSWSFATSSWSLKGPPCPRGHQVRDHLLHARVGDRGAVVVLVAGGEEILELEDPVRRAEVLVRDGPADGRLVDADHVGDLGHREGLQVGDAVLEEGHLGLQDLAGDPLDRALALLDRVDQELAGAHPLLQVVALVLGERALGDQVAVGARDPQARDVVVVEVDLPLVAVVLDDDVGDDHPVLVLGEPPARGGVQLADLLDRALHVVRGGAELAGELRDPPAGQELEVVADDPGGQGVAAALRRQLGEQALGQGLRADARPARTPSAPPRPPARPQAAGPSAGPRRGRSR